MGWGGVGWGGVGEMVSKYANSVVPIATLERQKGRNRLA